MDGSNAAFLLDEPLLSPQRRPPVNGILYIEDFDEIQAKTQSSDEAPEQVPLYTAADLEAAQAAGQAEGFQAALADEGLLQAQLQSAALQSLADALTDTRASLISQAQAQAAEVSLTLLSILQSAVPTVMRTHAETELHAMIEAILPGLKHEPELRVRAHPAMTDLVCEALITRLPEQGCTLSVSADPDIAMGDVKIAWRDGHANRDCAAIWAEIVSALASLKLPKFEDIDRGK